MINHLIAKDREAWLMEASEYLIDDILAPAFTALSLDVKAPSIRYSVSYAPNTRTGSKTLGVCSKSTASTGGHNEIYISPELDGSQSSKVLAVLLHELIHAYDDCINGHNGRFSKIARHIGYKTPLTELNPSDSLTELLNSYVDVLGDIPHDKMDYDSIKPKQTTRHKAVICGLGCGFKFRTSQKQIDLMTLSTCLCCGADSLVTEDNND